MKSDEFKNLVRAIVREEMNRTLPGVIKEVMAGMLVELAMAKGGGMDNTHKARALREATYSDASQFDEYPTMGKRAPVDRAKMAELMGYGDLMAAAGGAPVAPGGGNLITVDSMMAGEGDMSQPVPISPNSIPDPVLKAMNRDYRDFMKNLKPSGGPLGG